MTKEELLIHYKNTVMSCPLCGSTADPDILFVPAPDDEAVFNMRCVICGGEFEYRPDAQG